MDLFYLLFILIMGALAGCIAHIIRASFNLYPDRISDSKWINIAVSPGYSIEDHLLGIEFDKYSGYYKLLSLKNLKISVCIWTGMAFVAFLLYPDHQQLYGLIDGFFIGIGDLAVHRWNNLRLY